MTDIAIRVEGLSKRYRLGEKQESYQTLRDSLSGAARRMARRLRRSHENGNGSDILWALQGVSFEVKQGEVIGLIGRNGAGKSTLLKILSRITEPSNGYAEVYGRVGSLLEVGTGFHPELTGRENIYLNGAILGMRRSEIHGKFEEIVEFSGVQKFIDTPVKHYSSGMYLRLAFAVAAHFEPEILMVDEVLAVGDLEFQKKCLGRMSDVAKHGRTVLFVSHNLAAISSMTQRCLLLKEGKVLLYAPTEEAITAYHASVLKNQGTLAERRDRTGTGEFRFTAIELIHGETGEPVSSVYAGESLRIRVHWENPRPLPVSEVAVDIRMRDSLGEPISSFSTRFEPFARVGTCLPERGSMECFVPAVPLAEDDYLLDVWAGVRNRQADYLGNAATIAVRGGDYYGTGEMPSKRKHGGFLIRHGWHLNDYI